MLSKIEHCLFIILSLYLFLKYNSLLILFYVLLAIDLAQKNIKYSIEIITDQKSEEIIKLTFIFAVITALLFVYVFNFIANIF